MGKPQVLRQAHTRAEANPAAMANHDSHIKRDGIPSAMSPCAVEIMKNPHHIPTPTMTVVIAMSKCLSMLQKSLPGMGVGLLRMILLRDFAGGRNKMGAGFDAEKRDLGGNHRRHLFFRCQHRERLIGGYGP